MVVLQAKVGRGADFEARLRELAGRFRQAEGCLQYDCYQSEDNPTRFMLVMQWRDAESLARHFASQDLRELFQADLLESFQESEYRDFSRGAGEFEAV
jgi:quinol monooxygenase YgiN